jgi:hypothetical protein
LRYLALAKMDYGQPQLLTLGYGAVFHDAEQRAAYIVLTDYGPLNVATPQPPTQLAPTTAYLQKDKVGMTLPSVAYFSMEIAIDQELHIYSGGLGYLAGSHMRSAGS